MRSAELIIYKGREISRVMWFANHHQALDVAMQFKVAGYGWTLHACEDYQAGEIPLKMPEKQLKLFD